MVTDLFAFSAYDCNEAHKFDLTKNLHGSDKPQNEDYVNGTKAKMRSMFRAAKINGNDSLILSAFGCKAFKNDPLFIANCYKDLLNEPEFHNCFKIVSFAIYTKDNFDIFSKVFQSK